LDRTCVRINTRSVGPPHESSRGGSGDTNGGSGGVERRGKTRGGGARTPKAIVLEPARDLAEQTRDFFASFASNLRDPTIVTTLLVGGTDKGRDVRTLRDGASFISLLFPFYFRTYGRLVV
jgi:ATP-dependent RNA helicase DDX1